MATLRTAANWVRNLLERLGGLKWVMLALLFVGAGLIVLGAFANHYLASVLLEIGAAIFLVVPFIFLERVTASRIETVRSEVEDVRRAVRGSTQREEGWHLLHRAQDAGALHPSGVRVRLPDDRRLRFTPVTGGEDDGRPGAVRLTVEDRGGDPLAPSREWSEPAEDALAALVADLRQAGIYRGDESLDEPSIFRDLAESLEALLSRRLRSGHGSPLGPAVEVIHEWAITANGLEHIDDGRRVARANELFSRGSRDRIVSRLLPGTSGGDQTLDHALAIAIEYHKGEVRRRANAELDPAPVTRSWS